VSQPRGIAFDDAGNLYIAADNQVRRVGSDGIVTVAAGSPDTTSGFSGDNGPATITVSVDDPNDAVALERAKAGPVSICRACGVAATQSGAVKCTVCGAADFEVISREMIEKIAEVEGGLEEETTYDGRKLRWTEEARKGLWTMKNAYQRRRVKARVEKRARMMKLDAITLDFARQVIEEETGAPLEIEVPTVRGEHVEPRTSASAEATSGSGSRSRPIPLLGQRTEQIDCDRQFGRRAQHLGRDQDQ